MNTTSHQVVSSAIKKLLEQYTSTPLLYPRERTLQARLSQLVEHSLHEAGSRVYAGASVTARGTGSSLGTGLISRVQLEAKVGHAPARSKKAKEKGIHDDIRGDRGISDIVVLREADAQHPIRLTRGANGSLDLLAAIDPADVECVIEIKAACSADPEQRHLFRSDVFKLLTLRSLLDKARTVEDGIQPHCHFVLIDKSLAISPHCSSSDKKGHVKNWFERHRGPPNSRNKKQRDWEKYSGLEVSEAQHLGRVDIWDIDERRKPRRRVCTG